MNFKVSDIIKTYIMDKVHISQIHAGDTILHNGKLRTV